MIIPYSIPKSLVLLVSLLLSYLSLTTTALPSGSVGCEGGKAAVSGLHTDQGNGRTVLTGPLSDDNIEFQVNGVALQPGVPFNINIGADNRWRLLTGGTFFRGFLIRLGRGSGNVDTRQSLATDSLTGQVAEVACLEAYWVGGVTHTSNVLKNVEEGTLRVHLPSQNMPLDVTVVIQNRNSYSTYYYSGFIIHANAASGPTSISNYTGGVSTPTYTPYYPPPTAMPSRTPAPVTSQPTPAPVTMAPITPPPVYIPPTTSYPETQPPVTATPYTYPPITAPPETAPPITAAPITYAPITAAPVTNPPVTLAPVTAPPTTPAPVVPPTAPPVVQYLFLRYPTCSVDAPCTVCQGDCDTNDECAGTLECFHRPQDDTSPVPGCAGVGVAGRDYCYPPQPNSLRPRMPECTATNPCGACEGDCDDDSECAAGLTCFTRGTGELTPILGCSGLGIAGLDYCYNATAATTESVTDREDTVAPDAGSIPVNVPAVPTVSLPITPTTAVPVTPTTAPPENGDFSSNDQGGLTDVGCSQDEPCSKCEGDCQSDDSLCSGDLLCYVRPENDITRVLGCGGAGTAGMDYCWAPIANTLAIRTRPCTATMPCLKCEGGCDDDDDCSGDLRCFRRRDLSVVPGCGNGFFGVSFCWDPNDLNFGGRHMLRH